MKIIALTYQSTNCYLLETSNGWIMIDAGWPDTFPKLNYLLKQNDVLVTDIKYVIVTHFHPDHAGLVEDLKGLGIKLILHECQIPFVGKLNDFFKRNPKATFKEIAVGNNIVFSSTESRIFFKNLEIDGEIIQTPGHSNDSISIITDNCCAFTGDLPALALMEAYDNQTLKESWRLIQSYDVKKIYPAHGNDYDL